MNPSPHSSSKIDTTKVSTIITILIYFITFLMKKPPVVLASLTLVEIKTENAKVTTIRF